MSLVTDDRSVRSLLKLGIEQLRAAKTPSYTLAAELLLLHVSGRDRTWLYSHADEVLPPGTCEEYGELLRRRASGEPTQYLTGKQEFWGHEFEVTPGVLIPRPETEHLIEVALDRLAVREIRAGRPSRLNGENVTLVDIGTGSGCIAISLAKELPGAMVHATDISKTALEVARRNASRLGVSGGIQFVESNLLQAFHESKVTNHDSHLFDLIISNPPYVSLRDAESLPVEVREHEPHIALFGGDEGYELYSALISQAAQHLKPGGLLVLELGYSSLAAVQPLLDTKEWVNVGVARDLAGIPRVISAERLSPSR